MAVCNNLRKLRESKDVKQEDLALAVGLSTPTLSNIENGNDLKIGIIESFCNYLKVDISQVIPSNNTTFNFKDSPHSTANGNYHNYANEKLLSMLQKELEQKNGQIAAFLKKGG